MKNQIIKMALVFVFGIMTVSQVAAQSATENSVNKNDVTTKLQIKKDEFRIRINNSAKSNSAGKVTPENRFSFNLGSSLTWTMFYASFVGEDIKMEDKAIVNLVFIIDALEGLPEAEALQKTLKNIVRYTCKSQQCAQEIQAVIKSLEKQMQGESQWFFNTGLTVSNLYIANAIEDVASVKSSLTQIQALMDKAPKTIPIELISQMKTVTEYVKKEKLTGNDYVAISSNLDNLIGVIKA